MKPLELQRFPNTTNAYSTFVYLSLVLNIIRPANSLSIFRKLSVCGLFFGMSDREEFFSRQKSVTCNLLV